MKRFRPANLLSMAALLLVASGSASAASDDELAAEAARQFAEMKASMPLSTDRATIDYIACVANAVVQVLEPQYRDLPWEMAIFDNDSVNAFAMPGGKIGVMEGILKAAQNQDQLAAVIGHEIAHVTAKHSNERANRTKLSGVGIQVAAVLLQPTEHLDYLLRYFTVNLIENQLGVSQNRVERCSELVAHVSQEF